MNFAFFKYYGVDWILFALIVAQLWALGNKWRIGFLIGIAACGFGITLGIMIGSIASFLMNIVFAMMHLRAFLKWHKGIEVELEPHKIKIAEGTWQDE